jgi:DNA polymerase-1
MVSVYNPATDKAEMFYNAASLQRFLRRHEDYCLVMHNGIGFDIPVLTKEWGIYMPHEIADTYVMSRLWTPRLEGGHSLRAWGERIAPDEGKGDFTDFDGPADGESRSEWLERMEVYCIQDTKLTAKLYDDLMKRLREAAFTKSAFKLEHDTQRIMSQQTANGIYFDVDKARSLYDDLSARMREINDEMQEMFPPIVTPRYSDKQVDKATGEPKRLKDEVDTFNPGSRQKIADRLTEAGVVLTERTETGQYRIDETILEAIDHPAAQKIAEYMMVQKRIGQLDQWFSYFNEDTHRIHGRVDTMGTGTYRQSQSKPNLAQIPSVGKPYGKECRDLFRASPGMAFLGCDASGLELRCFANRTRNEEYIKIVTEGDAHQFHADLLGISRRDAKTFIYAFIYGAGNEKIGSIVGGSGSKARELFNSKLLGLKKLTSDTQRMAESGRIIGLDGRPVAIRSAHSALNFQLQSDGAILMKRACVNAHQAISENAWKAQPLQVVAAHDEWQFEVHPEDSDKLGKLLVTAIEQAGRDYNMACPLTGEYAVGNTWADTH